MESMCNNTLAELPLSCPFQTPGKNYAEVTLCMLDAGVCQGQQMQLGADQDKILVCRDPYCVFTDWQTVRTRKG